MFSQYTLPTTLEGPPLTLRKARIGQRQASGSFPSLSISPRATDHQGFGGSVCETLNIGMQLVSHSDPFFFTFTQADVRIPGPKSIRGCARAICPYVDPTTWFAWTRSPTRQTISAELNGRMPNAANYPTTR
jgi:hypothetical protein